MKKKSPTLIDEDNPEWTAFDFKNAKRFHELPVEMQQALSSLRGRPKLAQPKKPVSLRLSHEVVSAFRASGAGWQTRIDGALKDWLKTNTPG